MGIPTAASDGWLRNKGLRIIGGGGRIELDWPDLSCFPGYGMVRTRTDFDEILARHAEKAGARLLESVKVTGPLLDERTGRITGVTTKDGRQFRGRFVVAADGNSSRLSVPWACTSATTGRSGWRYAPITPAPPQGRLSRGLAGPVGRQLLLPGYGWIFGMGDGTSNVGLGLLNTSRFGKVDYRDLLRAGWRRCQPSGASPRRTGSSRSAAPRCRWASTDPALHPRPAPGGDAGGMVNPFNGEGIAYAMESGGLAADIPRRSAAADGAGASGPCRRTRGDEGGLGGYYTLGRVFVQLIGKPSLMRIATRTACRARPDAVRPEAAANLAEPPGGDAMDRIITRCQDDARGVPR